MFTVETGDNSKNKKGEKNELKPHYLEGDNHFSYAL